MYDVAWDVWVFACEVQMLRKFQKTDPAVLTAADKALIASLEEIVDAKAAMLYDATPTPRALPPLEERT